MYSESSIYYKQKLISNLLIPKLWNDVLKSA